MEKPSTCQQNSLAPSSRTCKHHASEKGIRIITEKLTHTAGLLQQEKETYAGINFCINGNDKLRSYV